MSSLSMHLDDSDFQGTIARLSDAAARPPMKDVATELAQHARETFRRERDPWGAPWPPHSPLTLKARRRRGNASQQRLIDSGAMYASIRDDYTDTTATVTMGEGLPDPRAVVHQFGTQTAGRSRNIRIPARPVFPIRAGSAAPPKPWWEPVFTVVSRWLRRAAQ